MSSLRFSVHELGYNDTDNVIDTDTGLEFDAASYSQMKYGNTTVTRRFASDISNELLEARPELIVSKQPPEFLVMYKAVPPACLHLSRFTLDRVNQERVENGNEPGRITQVFKSTVTATDYASAAQAAREQELSTINFSLENRSLKEVPVVILDDVRITGANERKMLALVKKETPRNITLGYYALFNSAQASSNPSIERELNSNSVKTIKDLLPMIISNNFSLNIRTLKMILSTNPEELEDFIARIPDSLLEEIQRGAIDTGPDFIQQYRDGCALVALYFRKRLG